ncbi:hypothetical protein ABT063_51060 [Streptomyces sp. NPDC002838]
MRPSPAFPVTGFGIADAAVAPGRLGLSLSWIQREKSRASRRVA